MTRISAGAGWGAATYPYTASTSTMAQLDGNRGMIIQNSSWAEFLNNLRTFTKNNRAFTDLMLNDLVTKVENNEVYMLFRDENGTVTDSQSLLVMIEQLKHEGILARSVNGNLPNVNVTLAGHYSGDTFLLNQIRRAGRLLDVNIMIQFAPSDDPSEPRTTPTPDHRIAKSIVFSHSGMSLKLE